ncbi:hypothetical protein MUK42_32862 [Musa troglodytarum]|uniref:Uncharacterized protein n=1 Tax=Musa troglodytarum TaxID=320322 RepID=A0A9E7L963_9LILI|nr:hypothetical protein MUK42_32862 [Musa troglodytarum]
MVFRRINSPVELPIHDERLSFSVIHPGFISWLGAHWEIMRAIWKTFLVLDMKIHCWQSCTETFGGIKVATHFHGGYDCKRLRAAQRGLVELKWQRIFMEV